MRISQEQYYNLLHFLSKILLMQFMIIPRQKVKDIRIDGGASNNNLLAQMFADYLDCRIVRPSSVEATSLGAAELAGLYSGFWKEEDLERAMVYDAEFSSQMEKELREKSYSNYKDAVKRCSGWMADK